MLAKTVRHKLYSITAAITAVIIITCAISGCGQLVRVIDENGMPIPNVRVTKIYPSYSGPSCITGHDGSVTIDGESEWLSLDKSGYDSDSYPWKNPSPLTVTLRKGSGNRFCGQIISLTLPNDGRTPSLYDKYLR
jgi:hypothetical protein